MDIHDTIRRASASSRWPQRAHGRTRAADGNDPKMQGLISSWVADQISDLSVFSQCLHQIELYQPWAATFETGMANRQDELREDYLKTQKCIEPYIHIQFGGVIASLDTPSSGRFHYPVDKRRTHENTEAMRQAEKHLDALWE